LKFLSIALVESGLDWNEINQKITHAVEIKVRRSGLVSGTPPGQQAVTDQQVMGRRRAFIAAMKEVSKATKGVLRPNPLVKTGKLDLK
jgi:hypothetical protein